MLTGQEKRGAGRTHDLSATVKPPLWGLFTNCGTTARSVLRRGKCHGRNRRKQMASRGYGLTTEQGKRVKKIKIKKTTKKTPKNQQLHN